MRWQASIGMSHAAWQGPSDEPCDFCDIQVDFKRQFQKLAPSRNKPQQEEAKHQHAPDKETVGNHSWTLLHTMAAYYPERPSEQVGRDSIVSTRQLSLPHTFQKPTARLWVAVTEAYGTCLQAQQGMQSFISSFAHTYPCRHCAEHLQAEMEEEPPKVESREELSQWWCRTHNKVNEQLDKPQFDCSKVLQRWRRANASTLAKEDEGS